MADLVCNYKRNIGIAFGLLFGFILLFCFYVIIVLAIAFPWTPEKLIRREQPRSADAVVVLDGEYYIRIEHAFKLLEAGFSDTLFTPGLRLTKNKQYIKSCWPKPLWLPDIMKELRVILRMKMHSRQQFLFGRDARILKAFYWLHRHTTVTGPGGFSTVC